MQCESSHTGVVLDALSRFPVILPHVQHSHFTDLFHVAGMAIDNLGNPTAGKSLYQCWKADMRFRLLALGQYQSYLFNGVIAARALFALHPLDAIHRIRRDQFPLSRRLTHGVKPEFIWTSEKYGHFGRTNPS